jgi:hypothetical protein
MPLVAVNDPQRIRRDHRQLVVRQVDDPLGMAYQRRSVAGQKMLPIADPDHQRAPQSRPDDHVRIVAKQNR